MNMQATAGPLRFSSLDAMQSDLIRGVFDVWQSVRGERRMPLRDDLSLKRIARFLPHLHLFEVLGPQRFRVRLCGTSMARVLGRDSTGSELTAESDDDLSRRTLTVVRRVVDAREPVLVFTERGAAVGTQIHFVESIWLPLSRDGAGVDQILSAAAVTVLPEFAEQPGRHGGRVQA